MSVRCKPRVLLWSLPLWAFVMGLFAYVRSIVVMPGESYQGALPAGTDDEQALAERLRRDVVMLGETIGERNHVRYRELATAMEYIEGRFDEAGIASRRETYESGGQAFANLVAELPGSRERSEILVVGAHYDSVVGSPGANDNATGVAALLALAAALAGHSPQRTLRFVAFVNEEPPHFQTEAMGSLVHARRCAQRGERVAGAISLETMGYYSTERGSQHYPPPLGWLYPSRGDFIGFVGNTDSRAFLHELVGSFRRHARFPSEGAALPSGMPGAGWSDHWAFWQAGYPGVMVTDTAPFRYPHYHTAHDTPDGLDYLRLARVVRGLEAAIRDLSR